MPLHDALFLTHQNAKWCYIYVYVLISDDTFCKCQGILGLMPNLFIKKLHE